MPCASLNASIGLASLPKIPWVLQDSFAPAAPWMIKGQIEESLRSPYLQKLSNYDLEGERYPIIHELSLHRFLIDGTFAQLKQKILTLKNSSVGGGEGKPEGTPASPRKTKMFLQDARERLARYEGHFRALERWALQDGKDKAISREAALDMAFRLFRASEGMSPAGGEEKPGGGEVKSESGMRYLYEVQRRRYPGPESGTGYKFGVAVIDLNVTGPNAVDRVLGDLVLEEAYQTFKEFFTDSVVTRGTRTNFRIVNPDGSQLSQEKLLELEKLLYQRIVKRAGPFEKKKWRKFLEGYQLNLSAGYEEVRFQKEEVQKGPSGEYTLETIVGLLEKIDRAFQMANARSQETTNRLKEVKILSESKRVPRLNHGQFPILDLNGPPEGRYFEPLEQATAGTEAIRIVHNLKRTFENISATREALAHLEYVLTETPSDGPAIQKAVEGLEKSLGLLQENQNQFRQVYFDISHDLRMPRMVDRNFAAERVDAVVRETGGARLLFVELGKFYSFVRTWYGGSHDQYVHELILDFYKVLAKKGLALVHPTNAAPIFADGHLAVDPKSGHYFSRIRGEGVIPPIHFLTNPRSSAPVARELIVGMRDGDEIGFVVGDREARGRYVSDRLVREIFSEFDDVVRKKYGGMEFDNIEKVGADKVRIPTWQVLIYRSSKKAGGGGAYVMVQNKLLKTEAAITRDFTGIVQDYVGVSQGELDPGAPKETAKVIVARRPRWRFFEGGKLSPKAEIHLGEPLFPAEGSSPQNQSAVPESWLVSHPEIQGKPLLVKMQTPLSAGYVSVKLRRGADLEAAWPLANNLSTQSKSQDGAPILTALKGPIPAKPPGHSFDRLISESRTAELSALYAPYADSKSLPHGPELSKELSRFIRRHQRRLPEFINPQAPEVFEQSMHSLIDKEVVDLAEREKLKAELREQVQQRGPLLQLRDALMVVQILQREGLSLNLKTLAPSLWQALARGQEAFGKNGLNRQMAGAKTHLVKLYVQQTGELPPPDILAEARKYVDPTSIFIPEEVYSLARRYKISPEKVPYFVAGLKADDIRKLGQEAFRDLTYEDLHRLAESREGQDFLRDPKNALLIRDTLGARVLYQGVPLATAMLSVFPAEMMAGYLAEKAGKRLGLSPKHIQEMKFGMTLYFAHGINLTASGMWEVTVNRMGAARALTGMIGEKVNVGILRTAKLAGQPIVQVGLKTGGGFTRALADGVLEKWGIGNMSRMGAKGLAWQGIKAIPRVPIQMLKTMGAGYLASRIYDRVLGTWLSPDHPARKYGTFAAFFLPDILRMTIGSSRIAASPLLRRAGGFFTRAGNRLLAVAITDFAFSQLFVGSDYDRWVQKRTADKVYENTGFLPWKVVRAATRELAPSAMDWALANDNSGEKRKILEEDLKNSREVAGFLHEGFAKILLHPSAFSLEDPASYQRIDFSMLTQVVVLDEMEQRVLKKFQDCSQPVGEKDLNFVPGEKMEEVLQRVYLYQLQQGVKYLYAVEQYENLWVRTLFQADGTLREGMGERLLGVAIPSAKGEPASEKKLLHSRKLLVAVSYLGGEKLFQGKDVESLAKTAGILDAQGKWILGPEIYSALSVLAEQARQNPESGLNQKIVEHAGYLQAEYLLASEPRKKEILTALACLGIPTPGSGPDASQ